MNNPQPFYLQITALLLLLPFFTFAQYQMPKKSKLIFEYDGSTPWQEQWMLDGKQSKIENTPSGINLYAGPNFKDDASHTVLWTKQKFKGDIAIEYDFTKLDTNKRCVNILYFLATGKGGKDYPKDISLWNKKREIPSMRTYFNNMNTYHISYAAYSPKRYGEDDYIRLRRYQPQKGGLKNTDITPAYFKTGLFERNKTYHIFVVKLKSSISMYVTDKANPTEKKEFHWDISNIKPCKSGNIGFRQMYTRNSRYENIKVWQLK